MRRKELEVKSKKYDYYLKKDAFNLKLTSNYYSKEDSSAKKVGCLSVVKTNNCCNV